MSFNWLQELWNKVRVALGLKAKVKVLSGGTVIPEPQPVLERIQPSEEEILLPVASETKPDLSTHMVVDTSANPVTINLTSAAPKPPASSSNTIKPSEEILVTYPKPRTLRDVIKTIYKDDAVKSYSHQQWLNHHWYFCGYAPCVNIRANIYNIITVIAASIKEQFIGRPDLRLSIGDGCPYPWSVQSETHREHVGGWLADFNIYTNGPDNITQYVPPWKQPRSNVWYKMVTPLWDDPMLAKGFHSKVVDVPRNVALFSRILDVMPHSTIIVHTSLWSLIRTEFEPTDPKLRQFKPDSSYKLHHQTHPHVNFGSGDIPNGRLIEWDKPLEWIPQDLVINK